MSSKKNIKTAAGFGGVGGAGSGAWAPGGSPGGGNYGDYNQFITDQAFESILARTHNPPDDDATRNFEARLVPFHTSKEDDVLGNIDILDPVERERIKLRAKLRDHKSLMESEAQKIKHTDNKESYISMEESLSKRRKYKEKQKFDYEDEVPAQIKPERLHYSSSQFLKLAKDFTTRRRDNITPSGPDDNPFYDAQFSNPQLGKTPLLTEGADIDKYFEDQRREYTPDTDGFRNEPTILDTLDPDAAYPSFSGKSSAENYDPTEQDKTIEQQLHTQEYALNNEYDRHKQGDDEVGFDDNPGLKGQGNFPRVPWAGSNL